MKNLEQAISSPPGDEFEKIPHPLDDRILALEVKLDDLVLQYTEKHPDIASTQRILERLRERKRRELIGTSEHSARPRLLENKAVQQLQVELSKSEANVAALNTRQQRYEEEVSELRRLVDTIPEVEAGLTQLNRDYGIQKQNYESLVKRRETAKLSREASETVDTVEFRLVKRARTPRAPSGPDRLMLTALVFPVAIGAGIGLAWLLSVLRPVFYTRKQLGDFTGLPVLGSVSLHSTGRESVRRWLGLGLYASGWLTLAGTFGIFAMASKLGIDLPARVTEMARVLL